MRVKSQFLVPIVASSLLFSLVIAPFVDSASAGWAEEGEPPTEYFGGGEDHTSDPDEPFDGLDRIVAPDENDDVLEPSLLLWLVRLVRSMWFLS